MYGHYRSIFNYGECDIIGLKICRIRYKTRCSAIAETALQGTLLLTESGKLKLGDNILLIL